MSFRTVSKFPDHKGDIYLLRDNGSYWSITSAEPINNGAFRCLHVGKETYIRKLWAEWIAHQKKFSGYDNPTGCPTFFG